MLKRQNNYLFMLTYNVELNKFVSNYDIQKQWQFLKNGIFTGFKTKEPDLKGFAMSSYDPDGSKTSLNVPPIIMRSIK